MKREEIIARLRRAEDRSEYSITRVDRATFNVANGDGRVYTVSFSRETGTCTCPDFRRNGLMCKHVAMVVSTTWPAQRERWVEKIMALAEDADSPNTNQEEDTMDKNSITNILKALAEPFPPSVVQWKPGAVAGNRALALAYVDSREYMARLDEADPGWTDDYQVIVTFDRILVICRLTVAGITRTGDGEALSDRGSPEENALTTASAQAFKRACAKFGLGRYLYEIPRVWVDYDPDRKRFTPEGLETLRRIVAGEHIQTDEPDARNNRQPEGRNGHENGQDQNDQGRNGQEPEIRVKFGKYAGRTLREIASLDPDYLEWLAREWQWEQGRKAAQALLGRRE